MATKKPHSVVLPALPSAVFVEREYLLTAWSCCVEREIVERLNMVAFGRWEAEPDTLSGFPQVRMKCSKERWVRRDMVVPRSLLELTHLYEAVTSHYAWADVGKDDRFGRSVRWRRGRSRPEVRSRGVSRSGAGD